MAALPEGLTRAEGLSGIVIFAIVYAVVAFLGKLKEAQHKAAGKDAALDAQRRARRAERARARQVESTSRPAPKQLPLGQARPGNTQAEAHKLEELLKVLGQAAGVPTTQAPVRRPSVSLPADEDVEDRQSLEVEEQVVSLEDSVSRPRRQVVDHDDDAEAVIRRRIEAARQRDRALNRADHLQFDERIRKVEADKTAVTSRRPASLREAIIWREILGPPVGLRGDQ